MKNVSIISLILLAFFMIGCKETPNIYKSELLGVWETDWDDILDGDLDELTVNEILYFADNGSFQQVFSGTVAFDDWENETEVSYTLGVEGTWEIKRPDEVILKYNLNALGVEIGKSSIEADYTDAAVGLLTGNWGGFLSGVLDSNKTDQLNKKVEAEVEKQITKFFKEMFREINKDKEALTKVRIDDNMMTAEINHGFFGREAVYNKVNTHDTYSESDINDDSGFIVELTGSIGDYPITMILDFKDFYNYDYGEVEGQYMYNSTKSSGYLTLKGIKKGYDLQLTEYNDKNEVTGRFEGTLNIYGNLARFEYSGTFTNYKGRTFTFNLSS